ncbi:MAG: hypothetical protein ACHQAX_02295 [Gammaproteobacteria bacterium]
MINPSTHLIADTSLFDHVRRYADWLYLYLINIAPNQTVAGAVHDKARFDSLSNYEKALWNAKNPEDECAAHLAFIDKICVEGTGLDRFIAHFLNKIEPCITAQCTAMYDGYTEYTQIAILPHKCQYQAPETLYKQLLTKISNKLASSQQKTLDPLNQKIMDWYQSPKKNYTFVVGGIVGAGIGFLVGNVTAYPLDICDHKAGNPTANTDTWLYIAGMTALFAIIAAVATWKKTSEATTGLLRLSKDGGNQHVSTNRNINNP